MAANVDLDGMSVQELSALIEAAETKRREKAEQEKTAFIAETRERAAKLGLSFDALFPMLSGTRKARKEGGGTVPVKYRGPEGQEWSGRGRLPNWLSALETQGRKREEFKV
jgi:DNA-binding protein H-NS